MPYNVGDAAHVRPDHRASGKHRLQKRLGDPLVFRAGENLAVKGPEQGPRILPVPRHVNPGFKAFFPNACRSAHLDTPPSPHQHQIVARAAVLNPGKGIPPDPRKPLFQEKASRHTR